MAQTAENLTCQSSPLMQPKKLKTLLFPIRQNEKYYVDALASGEFTKLGTRHVQTNNEDAINFYKKFEFEIVETIQNYHTNITPPDCYVLMKFVTQSQAKK